MIIMGSRDWPSGNLLHSLWEYVPCLWRKSFTPEGIFYQRVIDRGVNPLYELFSWCISSNSNVLIWIIGLILLLHRIRSMIFQEQPPKRGRRRVNTCVNSSVSIGFGCSDFASQRRRSRSAGPSRDCWWLEMLALSNEVHHMGRKVVAPIPMTDPWCWYIYLHFTPKITQLCR